MEWVSSKSDIENARKVAYVFTVEFSKDLCRRKVKPVCGLKQNDGTYLDVAEGVKTMLTFLGDEVEINMDLSDDGKTWKPLQFNGRVRSGNIRKKFDPQVPIRFLFYNGDIYKFPLDELVVPRGWGVDLKTEGLVVFIGIKTEAYGKEFNPIVMHFYVQSMLFEISGAQYGNDVIDKERKDILMDKIYHGDIYKRIFLPIEP